MAVPREPKPRIIPVSKRVSRPSETLPSQTKTIWSCGGRGVRVVEAIMELSPAHHGCSKSIGIDTGVVGSTGQPRGMLERPRVPIPAPPLPVLSREGRLFQFPALAVWCSTGSRPVLILSIAYAGRLMVNITERARNQHGLGTSVVLSLLLAALSACCG